jgi:hypothetical protein
MSKFNTILPPSKLRPEHTYESITSNEANRYVFRIHRAKGRGALIPSVGFVSYGSAVSGTPDDYEHFRGRLSDLIRAASRHITQWKYKTTDLPSPFVSASFSMAYVLFEAHRWNRYHRCTSTQISVIDTSQLTGDVWLATELVGASRTDAAYFARSAQEVLVYRYIPFNAVVVTMSVYGLLACLPRWCDDIPLHLLRSTQQVVNALTEAADCPEHNTLNEDFALRVQSVEHSILLLRDTLPEEFDPDTHTDQLDAIARLAAVFMWWPKWITGFDPVVYRRVFLSARKEAALQLSV